ncbi:hypothetical protein LTR99_002389 [Exophiala xenobiotica]|uniref:SMP-30/Gluconolactonase/LRE-like region domain-containing protein n=1 Tax=Vermiconidia calcicola TaxID=1690605 RepID=A0AAV9QFZ1_9PEZI|nr:hypothetical protein LTR96_002627 [Exophiala xenobiotica]KAK5541538.1 hypothetical protein LTR23_005860 [Chaetothyriales sp. CCFEE 6169]KAK5542274.1 hypothetical protein LTR25_002159 [Vermiconidia calcicola]KAK5306697.1 hypothetical protein LTR99_002389 [Exophiala xenobiotica]KAK5341324.1 hypothetical protein LTR98_002116 [Exophiala xenobiotica]
MMWTSESRYLLLATTSLAWGCSAHISQRGSPSASPFTSYSPAFDTILGTRPEVSVVFNQSERLFYEGGVYHPPTDSLFTVSDRISITPDRNDSAQVLVRVANVHTRPSYEILNLTSISNPISGVRYKAQGANGTDDLMAFVAWGNSKNDPPGGLYTISPYPPYKVNPLTTALGVYHYNAPDNVTVLPDGTMYFTDPTYGYQEGLRPDPLLPNQVYRYDPATNTTRVAVDGLGRPNGITHSPDGTVLYIGDTGARIGNGSTDYQGPRTTYGFDVKNLSSGAGGTAGPFVTDRRVFAMPYDLGANDGLKTDLAGNVWGLSVTGVFVWNASGDLLGHISVPTEDGGNIGFGRPGELFINGGNVLYRMTMNESVIGTGVWFASDPGAPSHIRSN